MEGLSSVAGQPLTSQETLISGRSRIGEFSRRVGVSASVLRAWEARYGLLTPARSSGGYRLYGPEDERRARRMRTLLRRGLPAGESARLALDDRPALSEDGALLQLVRGWETLDAARVHLALDELLAGPEPEVAACRVIIPQLHRLSEAWREDRAMAGCGHFAERLLETRLLTLADRWHEAPGPLALVGCGPAEQHALGAIALGLALHRRRWRIAYLGADVPAGVYEAAARTLGPALVVVCLDAPQRTERLRAQLGRLATEAPLALAGRGASAALAAATGARLLQGDPLDVASAIAI